MTGITAKTKHSCELISAALNKGFTPSDIAESMGISPSAVTQLIDQYSIQATAAKQTVYKELDDIYDDIELKVAQKLQSNIARIHKPMEMLAVLTRVNSLTRRHASSSNGSNANNSLVSLTLPAALLNRNNVKVVLSSRNEVLEVEGRVISTVDTKALDLMSMAPIQGELAEELGSILDEDS